MKTAVTLAAGKERNDDASYPLMQSERKAPFSKDILLSYLAKIFPEKDLAATRISKMGGMSNKNYRVEVDDASYILRVPGNGSDGMIERANEEFNANEGSKLGVNPKTYYFDPKTGIKLTEFIKGAETLNSATIQRHDNMKQIAAIYRRVHGARMKLRNEFNIFREIEKYDVLIRKSGAVMYSGHETVRKGVMALEGYLNDLGVALKPCHNDAVPENFIKSEDGKIYLIDWEYSGMNDPMADLAALFLESEFTVGNQDFMLQQYFGRDIPQNTHKKILCYQILWDYLWAQWTVIKEAKGDSFGSYGIERYNRAKNNLDILSHQ